MSEEDVQNMLEIVSVLEFKVKALQVKCPIIDWEIHIEGSRTYWKIIRVSGITEAYQSFEDMLKGFDREDLVALWNLVKEKFTMPSVDKEKALWVELKRLFEPDADDVLWKLQRLQVEEDNEMARDLMMKIFMKANKPKSRKIKTASTSMETQKPLLKDKDGKEVDVHMYRSMIGSLMYRTSSRPDIMFAVCACARYQVNPKFSHLHAMKRIFRYLKGQPKLGLWYPKDSPFDLVAYTDSDYAGASLDGKSTTEGKAKKRVRLMMEKPFGMELKFRLVTQS
nr:hypothetical protein [Tanacetum cinerariifolium]